MTCLYSIGRLANGSNSISVPDVYDKATQQPTEGSSNFIYTLNYIKIENFVVSSQNICKNFIDCLVDIISFYFKISSNNVTHKRRKSC